MIRKLHFADSKVRFKSPSFSAWIKIVKSLGHEDISVCIEAFESRSLVVQIALNLKFAVFSVCGVLKLSSKFGSHAIIRKAGDVPHHSSEHKAMSRTLIVFYVIAQ